MTTVTLNCKLMFTICVRAPTKLDFIDALGYVQPDPHEQTRPNFIGAPREWYQMVAKQMALPCKHEGCSKNTVPDFGLVSNCYKRMPLPDISNPAKMQRPYFMSDTYEVGDCCCIDSEKYLKCDLSRYGYSVVRDIVMQEKKIVAEHHMVGEINRIRQKWKEVFIKEMKLMLGLDKAMPQDFQAKFEEEEKKEEDVPMQEVKYSQTMLALFPHLGNRSAEPNQRE